MVKNLIKTTLLCLIAGITLSGCSKDEAVDDDVSVAGITMNETSKTLTVGETFVLTTLITPNDATDQTLEWSSSNTAVAAVNSGAVTAVATGEAVITVRSIKSGKTATCAIMVGNSEITMKVADDVTAVDIGLAGSGTATVDWGDGKSSTLAMVEYTKRVSHTYAAPTAVRTITITGDRITQIVCSSIGVTEIDLSKSPSLLSALVYYNRIASLDLSKNTELVSLDCRNNQITSLDLSANTELRTLNVSGNSGLTTLNLSANTKLTELYYGSSGITNPTFADRSKIRRLSCSNRGLTSIDLSGYTALEYLDCGNNNLTELNLSANTALTQLLCSSNSLTAAIV
jgi:hypothetical protein